MNFSYAILLLNCEICEGSRRCMYSYFHSLTTARYWQNLVWFLVVWIYLPLWHNSTIGMPLTTCKQPKGFPQKAAKTKKAGVDVDRDRGLIMLVWPSPAFYFIQWSVESVTLSLQSEWSITRFFLSSVSSLGMCSLLAKNVVVASFPKNRTSSIPL